MILREVRVWLFFFFYLFKRGPTKKSIDRLCHFVDKDIEGIVYTFSTFLHPSENLLVDISVHIADYSVCAHGPLLARVCEFLSHDAGKLTDLSGELWRL